MMSCDPLITWSREVTCEIKYLRAPIPEGL